MRRRNPRGLCIRRCHCAIQKWRGSMKIKSLSLLGLLVLALSIPSFSQTFRGGITGTLTDPSGAAIAGGSVQAVNTETGLRRGVPSSSPGEFTLQDLPLGTYELTVTEAGFDKLKIDKVAVEVGKVTSLRLTLRVATQSQTVEVTSQAFTLDAETSTINQVIPNRAVQDMPLNGRDFTQLQKLAPGWNGAGSLNGARTIQANQQLYSTANNHT